MFEEKTPWHRHLHLIGGLARQAAIYPPKLVQCVVLPEGTA